MTDERTAHHRALPHEVYWLYDGEGRLLYIGATRTLATRMEGHRGDKRWWPEVQRIETESFSDWYSAHDREGEAIRQERPIHNRLVPKPPMVLPPIIRRDEPIHAVEAAS